MQNFVERLKQGLTTPVPGGDYSSVKRVAIVGAGVAGLQTARQLSSVGIECVIFEKSDNVGGVWRENYADFGLQVPKELYEFPGFPYPKGYTWGKFPKGPEVQKYIELYAKEFKINDMCKFETAVLALSALTGKKPGWKVKFQKKGESVKEEDFDFAVVATGMYGWPPHIPYARGHQKFKGKILHSCTFTDKKMAAGKKVVVVGGGKSAVDNAVAAAKTGVSSTLVTRTPHWPVPRYLAHLVPFQYGTYSRFGHFMLPTHHEEGNCFWWLHSTCAPVKKAWWKVAQASD
jgi:dimethylaniline monooxygenase (N-oxide forming)